MITVQKQGKTVNNISIKREDKKEREREGAIRSCSCNWVSLYARLSVFND